jgi:Serpentine type 7TM GPCR chemoreceptor Srw
MMTTAADENDDVKYENDGCRTILHYYLGSDDSFDAQSPGGTTSDDLHQDTGEGDPAASFLSNDAERTKYILLSVINPTLCVVGLVGNTLNIVVMTRRRMRSALDGRMERAARTGLVSLAAADMLCCAVSLAIAVFSDQRLVFRSRDQFQMLLKAYGPYMQNAMARTSTWLTVVTAVGRYFAICRPLQTRHAAEPRTTRIAVMIAFVGSALMELPTAWTYRPVRLDCKRSLLHDSATVSDVDDDVTYYLLDHGPFGSDDRLRTSCTVIGAVVGYLLPAAILSFCTARLVAALRESVRIARYYHADARHRSGSDTVNTGTGSARGRRLTVTLVAIVVFYLLLVSPSELLHMLYYAVKREHWSSADVAIDIANVLGTANFALNFVLYCAFNSQFRATWKHLFCPRLGGDALPGVGDGGQRTTRGAGGCATVRYDRRLQHVMATMTPATSAAQGTTSGRIDVRLPVVVTFSRQEQTSRSSSSSATTR